MSAAQLRSTLLVLVCFAERHS